MYQSSKQDLAYLAFVQGRLGGMRVNRYSWWTHWRELADYFLPRRYKWLITPNQQSRGSPINQHIIDSTGCFAARNLASGLLSGKSSPTQNWFKLSIGRIDSVGNNPVSLWLSECERLMKLVFHESNFYNSIATFYFDLVIFGTGVMLIYEDYDNVINCFNPCAGEYYVDIDGAYRPVVFYREFTMSVSAIVDEFGYDNCPEPVQRAYKLGTGAGLTEEYIIAHALEPNTDDKDFGIPKSFPFRECYWVYGGSQAQQGNGATAQPFLRKRGYQERPNITVRWDLVSNDPYGRSPAMDGLGDQKQLQLETRRKAQAIDKMVNPPLVADIQLKNQPASLLPGGMTYIDGFARTGKPAISTIYDTRFSVAEVSADLEEVRQRLSKVFFNDLFLAATQYETRSNVTAVEWNMRKAESMIMLGPVLERIDNEGLKPTIERTFGIMSRAGIFPPAPPEIQGQNIEIQFVSMLAQAQSAVESFGIERLLQMAGGLVGVDPQVMDNIDNDFAIEKYSTLMNNDPRLIRSPEARGAIRQQRQEQMAQQQAMAQAETAQKLAQGAETLSKTQVGGGANALQAIMGGSA